MRIIKGKENILLKNVHKNILVLVVFILLAVTQDPAISGFSTDVSQVGIGARPLGMGKAYTALANDTSAMYLNPAGLAQLTKPQLLSMQGSLLNDINYLTLGVAAPFGPGTIGLGLIQASIEGIALTELDSNGRPRVYDEITYFEGVWNLAYALPLNEIYNNTFQTKLAGKLYGGTSFKFFHKGAGTLYEGNGLNADLGLLYIQDEQWRFGLNYKNIVPPLGALGSINWNTGAKDYLVSYTTLGAAYKVNRDWQILCDYDFAFGGGRKSLFHFGTEYQLENYVTLRAGYEQLHDATGTQTFGDLTLGLSLRAADWVFDYAYHPYQDQPENTVHYLSINYHFGNSDLDIFKHKETDAQVITNTEPIEGEN